MTIWTNPDYSQRVVPFVEIASGVTLRYFRYGIRLGRVMWEQCGREIWLRNEEGMQLPASTPTRRD